MHNRYLNSREVEIVRGLLRPILHSLKTTPPEAQFIPLPHDLLLEIHTTLHSYREALELQLSATTFADTVMPEATTFSQVYNRDSWKGAFCSIYHKRIAKVMEIIEPLETIIAEKHIHYDISRELLPKIKSCLMSYFYLLKK
ncbi:MAG: hypothetical protein HWN66_15745 [Candidatus Helarchaeota archaeon]|nr:hypothetical protein [Candidatus Helarchaeota archaeon]